MSQEINIVRLDRDDPVRSFWVFDHVGNKRAQLWLNPPDAHGAVTVCVAAFDSSSPTKWGAREERHATLATLAETLESLRLIVFGWAGPDAFTSP
jgi:hypothetical protein